MRVGLTGTPGVGKTSVAAVAARQGWRVVDVKAWAREAGAVAGHDQADGADAIDVGLLAGKVPADDGSRVLYEGHLSHLLPVEQAWVLRCDPAQLRPRLEARGYPAAKVAENLEAEALDIVLQEALDHAPRVLQLDGTRRTPEAIYKAFADIAFDSFKGNRLEPVDWSHRLPLE